MTKPTPQVPALAGMTPLGLRPPAKAAKRAAKLAKPAQVPAAKAAKPTPAPAAKSPWREPMPADLQAIGDAATREPKWTREARSRQAKRQPDRAANPPAAEEPEAKTPKAPKVLGRRAQIAEDAEAGKLPTPPDFSANTHKPYRKRLKVLVELAEAGDVRGLRDVAMLAPRSSSPKALLKYRDLAVTALEARAAKAAAQ